MKSSRQEKILAIIERESIETQNQLMEALAREGVKSTQATLSRDIRDLHLVKELAADGMTMVIVTHEMAFARDIADKVIFMDKGLIVEEGGADTFFASPKEERTRQFLDRVKNLS